MAVSAPFFTGSVAALMGIRRICIPNFITYSHGRLLA